MTAQQSRRLWLCADDYGISAGVDRAIRDLIDRGRINATSVMVAAPGFARRDADALAALGRGSIGLHFALTAPFRPMTDDYRPAAPDGAFPTLSRTLVTGLMRRFDSAALAAEASSQIAAFISLFGRPPDFVDGHQHVHMLPQAADALLAAMKEAAPNAWIRQCGRAIPLTKRWRDPKGLFLDVLSRRLRTRCVASGIAANAAFAGTYDFKTKRGFDELFGLFLDDLPDGSVVMCHPGFVDTHLRRIDNLTERREEEYAYLAGERFPQLLASRGYVLA